MITIKNEECRVYYTFYDKRDRKITSSKSFEDEEKANKFADDLRSGKRNKEIGGRVIEVDVENKL